MISEKPKEVALGMVVLIAGVVLFRALPYGFHYLATLPIYLGAEIHFGGLHK